MAHFIDRRLNGKNKNTVNRQRFIKRYKRQIKEAVSDAIAKRSVTDVETGESISIPSRDMQEPIFHQGKGGKRDMVHPGNAQFSQGDRIKRPLGGQGQGAGEGDASDSGEGQDDFVFSISKDEYLDLLFEDLALPNLKQNQLNKLVQMKTHRAGYSNDGVPSNIDIVRSLQGSVARRIAMTAGKKRQLAELEQKLEKSSFKRIDSDSVDKLIETDIERESTISKDDQEKVKELELLESKYSQLKSNKTFEGSIEDKRETKKKINALIREIDKCIVQLND